MRIYSIKFKVNGKKYRYSTTNYKLVKRLMKRFKNNCCVGSFDYNEL